MLGGLLAYVPITAGLGFLLRFRPSSASTVRTKECNDSFQQLKAALLSAPVLAYPHSAEPFVLDTDATNVDIGAVLSQVHNGEKRVIAFYSRALSKPERDYCTTRRELL